MRIARSFLPLLLLLLAGCGSSRPLATGTTQPLESALPEAIDGGWLEGDLHVHDDHSSDGSLPRQASDQKLPGNNPESAQIGIAEVLGLDFLPLTDHRTYDQQYDPLWRSEKLLLIPGEEANGRPHATVHGAVDTIVQGADVPDSPMRRKLQQSIWDAHSQDANWTTAHPDDGERNDDGTPNDFADAVGPDLIEVWNKASNSETEIDYAENRWNAGFRTGVAGGSDDHFIEVWAVASPGQPRSGAFAAAHNERALVHALRNGRTRVCADAIAPTLELRADAGELHAFGGDELVAPAGTPVTLHISVANAPGDVLRIYKSPGRAAGVLREVQLPVLGALDLDLPVSVDAAPSWYRAEVRGTWTPASLDYSSITADPVGYVMNAQVPVTDQLRAIVSPIFVSTAPVEPVTATPTPSDFGVDDRAIRVLGAARIFYGFPDIAQVANIVHVVAERHSPLGSQVVYRRADGAEQALSANDMEARFPRIAARGSDVWAVWQQEPSANEVPRCPAVVLRHSADGGATWQPSATVRTLDGRAEHPALALTGGGAPVIVWQEIAPGRAFDVFVKIGDDAPLNLSGNGKSVAAASLLDARTARYPASVWPALAVSPDGAIAIAWQDDRDDPDPLWTGQTGSGDGTDPDDWQIFARVRGAEGWSDIAKLGASDRADRHPTLSFTTHGRLVAAWDSRPLQSSGANLNVLSAHSDDGGASWSAPAAVFENTNAMSQWPRLSANADAVRLAWSDTRSADWRWRVATAVLTDAGWNDFKLLPGRGNNTWPVVGGDHVVFASTRDARRLQRDITQGIYSLELGP